MSRARGAVARVRGSALIDVTYHQYDNADHWCVKAHGVRVNDDGSDEHECSAHYAGLDLAYMVQLVTKTVADNLFDQPSLF